MLEHSTNRKSLLDVESAIAHVSLDDSSPEVNNNVYIYAMLS